MEIEKTKVNCKESAPQKRKTYSERAAEFMKQSESNQARFHKIFDAMKETRGNNHAIAKLRWALGLDDVTKEKN